MKLVGLSVLHAGRLYPLENIPGTHFVRSWVDPRAIMGPEGLCQLKIPMTPSGIEPATFWLVAQCHYMRYLPKNDNWIFKIFTYRLARKMIDQQIENGSVLNWDYTKRRQEGWWVEGELHKNVVFLWLYSAWAANNLLRKLLTALETSK
jgi:hypothetical protein